MTAPYEARATEHALRRDAELRQSVHISRARLVVFLSAMGCLIWTLARGADPVGLGVAAVLFLAFGGLVFWHARVEERAAWHDALRTVSLRGSARTERRWDDLPAADAPASIDLAHHPYARDLDLFGRASLFQWLGPAATPRGSLQLADWLLEPTEPAIVRARQAAVRELASAEVWRERLAAHGILAQGARQAEIDAFLSWAEGGAHGTVFFGAIYSAAVLLTASIWLLLILFVLGFLDAALWLLPLLAGLVFSFAYAKRIYTEFDRAGAGLSALARYAALFEHATETPSVSPALRDAARASVC